MPEPGDAPSGLGTITLALTMIPKDGSFSKSPVHSAMSPSARRRTFSCVFCGIVWVGLWRKTRRTCTHPVGNEFLESLGKCTGRNLAVDFYPTVLGEGLGKRKRVELDVRRPVCQALEDCGDDIPCSGIV